VVAWKRSSTPGAPIASCRYSRPSRTGRPGHRRCVPPRPAAAPHQSRGLRGQGAPWSPARPWTQAAWRSLDSRLAGTARQRPARRCGRSWPPGGCATALVGRRRGWVEGDQLGGAGRLGASLVGELGPQISLVGPQQRRGCPAMRAVGNAPQDDPSLNRLGSTPTWAATSGMVSRAPVMRLRGRWFATEPPGRRDRTFPAYRDVPTNPAGQFSRPAQRPSDGASPSDAPRRQP
jgi:hypothetical protein